MRIFEQGFNEAWFVIREGVFVFKVIIGFVFIGQNNVIVIGKYIEFFFIVSFEIKNINYIVIMKEEYMCIYIFEI